MGYSRPSGLLISMILVATLSDSIPGIRFQETTDKYFDSQECHLAGQYCGGVGIRVALCTTSMQCAARPANCWYLRLYVSQSQILPDEAGEGSRWLIVICDWW